MVSGQYPYGSGQGTTGAPLEVDPALCLDDFPIPQHVTIGKGWCASMIEMADHIGPRAVLLLCEAKGGQEVYNPANWRLSPFIPIIGEDKARVMSAVYRRERLMMPLGKAALARARRGALLAHVRHGNLSIVAAASILGMRRDNLSREVNKSTDGADIVPGPLPVPRGVQTAHAAAEIAAHHMEAANCTPEQINDCREDLLDALMPMASAFHAAPLKNIEQEGTEHE